MLIAALVLAGVAAAIHVYIWVLESLAWNSPRARSTFGTTPEQARQTASMAFNQGYYNLFLALAIVIGIVCTIAGSPVVGATLVFVGAGSMVGAGLVLALSDRSKLRPALIQLTPPALAIIALAVSLTM